MEQNECASRTYAKHLKEGLLGHNNTLELLLLLNREFRYLLKRGVVGLNDGPILDSHLIEEAILGRGPDAEVAAVVTLSCLSEDVRRRVPENAFA